MNSKSGSLSRADLVHAEQVLLGPRAVEEADRALAALAGELAQQREDRRHPRAARDHQDRVLVLASAQAAVRTGEAELVTGLDLTVEHAREAAAGIALDDQLDPVLAGKVGHRERTPGAARVARDVEVHVLARGEVEAPRAAQDQPDDVVRQRLHRLHLGRSVTDRVLEPVAVRIEVQQLNDEVLFGHRPAHQRVAVGALGVRECEVGVALERDVALEQKALAGRALALATAVDEVVALAERGVEDRLLGPALDLLADRLEANARHRLSAPVAGRQPQLGRHPDVG